MTEEEWLQSVQTGPMVHYLMARPKGLSRKLRLFAAACCRRVWHLLPDEPSRQAVVVAEHFADRQATTHDLKAAYQAAGGDRLKRGYNPAGPVVGVNAPSGALWAAQNTHTFAAQHDAAGNRVKYDRARADAEDLVLAHLLRDVMGNLFRPRSVDRAWVTPTVSGIARTAYEERTLPAGTLEEANLAILADALEEAGCTDAEIVDHLRGPGPHVRGCWVLDVLLDKK